MKTMPEKLLDSLTMGSILLLGRLEQLLSSYIMLRKQKAPRPLLELEEAEISQLLWILDSTQGKHRLTGNSMYRYTKAGGLKRVNISDASEKTRENIP